jgi:hypothetical protein
VENITTKSGWYSLTLGGSKHQGENDIAGRRGQNSREKNLKESECEEGHIALRVK